MTEILVAFLLVLFAWDSYNDFKKITELEERLNRLERKTIW